MHKATPWVKHTYVGALSPFTILRFNISPSHIFFPAVWEIYFYLDSVVTQLRSWWLTCISLSSSLWDTWCQAFLHTFNLYHYYYQLVTVAFDWPHTLPKSVYFQRPEKLGQQACNHSWTFFKGLLQAVANQFSAFLCFTAGVWQTDFQAFSFLFCSRLFSNVYVSLVFMLYCTFKCCVILLLLTLCLVCFGICMLCSGFEKLVAKQQWGVLLPFERQKDRGNVLSALWCLIINSKVQWRGERFT